MSQGKVYMVGVFGLVGLSIVCLTALLWAGRDVAQYLTVVAPVVTVLLGQMVISKQVGDVQETVKKVEHQTNGQLAAQFADVKEHIDNAVSDNG